MSKTKDIDINYFEQVLDKPDFNIPQLDVSDLFKQTKIPTPVDRMWVRNYYWNREGMVRFPHTTRGHLRATVLVGASPAVKRNIHHLKNADDTFIIICSPTILKFLLDSAIKPDYVFACEGRDHWVDDFDCDTKDLTLIASPFIAPNALDKWQGEVYFYIVGGGRRYDRVIRSEWPNVDVSGGNSISTAFLWAYGYLRSRHFIFTGTSFCYYKADNYYFDGRPQPVEDLKEWEGWHKAMDIHGDMVDATPTQIGYKVWLEAMTRELKGRAEIVNSTEDGIFGVLPQPVEIRDGIVYGRPVYLPWINIIPLNLAIDGYKEKLGGNNNGPSRK